MRDHTSFHEPSFANDHHLGLENAGSEVDRKDHQLSKSNLKTSILIFLFSLLTVATSLTSEVLAYGPRLPKDIDKVDIYLHTIDIGDLVYNNFGHTAIRVRDREAGTDWVFNWGIFDFGEPVSFALKFYKGILIYQLGVYPYRNAQYQYQREGRTVWEDELNLSPDQKKKLLEKLIWNAQPENRPYRYHYFFDNCSTRPRDYLDEALGGMISRVVTEKMTDKTFRDYVRSGYEYNPFIQLSLDILMNSDIDRQVSEWESMFHPIELRRVLLELDDQYDLILSSRVLYEFKRPQEPWFDGPTWFAGMGTFAIVYVIFMWQYGYRRHQNHPLESRSIRFGYRVLGLLSLPIWIYGGILGLLMPVTWAFSEHTDLHHNFNMLIFWPIDLMMLRPAWHWMVHGQPWYLERSRYQRWRFYCVTHIVVLIAFIMLWSLNLVQQNVGQVALFVMPVYLALFSMALNQGIRPKGTEKL